MARFATAYGLTLLVFLAIDFIWLSAIAREFYTSQLKNILLPRPNFFVAGLFYALFCVGLVQFAVLPALDSGGAARALGLGALLGLIAYATYDLSNLATLKGWPLQVTLVDIAWGAFLGAASAWAGYSLTRLTGVG